MRFPMKNIAKKEKHLDVMAYWPDAGAALFKCETRKRRPFRGQSPEIPYGARGKKHQKCLTPRPKNSINMIAL
jgi:hypothetical protein